MAADGSSRWLGCLDSVLSATDQWGAERCRWSREGCVVECGPWSAVTPRYEQLMSSKLSLAMSRRQQQGRQQQGNHTIVLKQTTDKTNSRTYSDFPSEQAAFDAITGMFEQELKKLNPQVRNLSYDVADMFRWIDSLGDLCAMTLDSGSGKYTPHDRKWIKDKIFNHMKSQSGY